ncbi:PepSY-associated TM helix domain-containing protein [Spongiibacter taiwanensis]
MAKGWQVNSLRRWALGSLRQWHWISSAVCLVAMLGFAITGVTLNHASWIPATPTVVTVEAAVPESVLASLQAVDRDSQRVPAELRRWLISEKQVYLPPVRSLEWSKEELYLAMPQPGADAWLSVDLASGNLLYERTDRGWVAYFNDLHKGRDTGLAWIVFIDVFAVACVVFSISGLLLLQRQTRQRPSTWPAVALGLLIPALILVLFVH